ncbi:MAG: osmoprotectant NAGGN system M42 family peptidase [Phycisphaeraceae bacterium]
MTSQFSKAPTQTPPVRKLPADRDYLLNILIKLLSIPSPSGYTDSIVRFVGEELERLGIDYELTRRGAIRASMVGKRHRPNRAIVAHLDTIGAMVRELKPNGRLGITAIGTWAARFAEGARVTVFTDDAKYRGTILPLKASGHVWGPEIDRQPADWDNLEIRVDEYVPSDHELRELGLRVGDYVSVDPAPEVTDSGFIVSRHLDNKAGVACVLAAAKSVIEAGITPPLDCHLLFTIFEEVGTGSSGVLHQDVAEMLSVDNATPASGQNATETEVTIAMKDDSGPFDYHLSRKLAGLARDHHIRHQRDVMRYYRCDSASAVEAGNDIRTGLVCFGADASHGYERTHIGSLASLAQLLGLYLQSPAAVERDRMELGPLKGFPEQPTQAPPIPEKFEQPPHKTPPAGKLRPEEEESED